MYLFQTHTFVSFLLSRSASSIVSLLREDEVGRKMYKSHASNEPIVTRDHDLSSPQPHHQCQNQ